MAKKKMGNTVSAVWNIAEPIALELGFNLWDIRFVKEGAMWYLRVFIDKDDGITIEDCESMSRALDAPLDEHDIIDQSYCLEVSSPGLERELVRDEHFEKFKGSPIILNFVRPLDNNKKELKGTLVDFSSEKIILNTGDDNLEFSRKIIASVKLDDFGGYKNE